MMRLESRCSKLILDCIDWREFYRFKMDPTDMYDMLYSVYCAKLTKEGYPKTYEDQLRQYIDEGKDEARQTEKQRSRKQEENLAWYVFGALAIIMVFIYYLVLMFTICDDSIAQERQMKAEAIKLRQQREKNKLQQTAAKTLPMMARKVSVGKND